MVAEIAVADADEPALLRAAYNLRSDAAMPEQVAAEAVAGRGRRATAVEAPQPAPADRARTLTRPEGDR